MAYRVKSTTSYGGRLNKALKGIVGGFIMFIGGTILLFWNEGNFVKTKKAIQEAEGACVAVEDVSKVDASLNGTLIHASAFADTKDELTDEAFGVTAVAIAINRKVEYYQWEENAKKETRDKIGGGQETITTYTYKQAWVDKPIDSMTFEDPQYTGKNTVLVPTVEKQTVYAQNVSFGAYTLPGFFIESIKGNTPAEVNLTDEQKQAWTKRLGAAPAAAPLPAATAPAADAAAPEEEAAPAPAVEPSAVPSATVPAMIHVVGHIVYFGRNPNAPEIGDMRITLTKVMPADVSIIGKVVGSTFGKFVAKNGKTFTRLEMGTVSPEEMFANALSENVLLVWILRLIGILLVIFGLNGIFGIITEILKVLPFLANIVGAGIGLVCFILGLAWSLIIIALAWLTYRPLIGVPLLVCSIGLVYYLKKIAPKNKAQPPAEPPSVA